MMKTKLMLLLASLASLTTAAVASPIAQAPAPRVIMMIGEGFFAPEYYTPRAIFDKAGFRVKVAGRYAGLVSPDRRNTEYQPVRVDMTFEEIDLSQYDALVFAGGNGAWGDYFPNETVHSLVQDAFKRKMKVAMLCASTGLLGLVNNFDGGTPIAEGRHVTGYFKVEGILRQLGRVNYDAGEKSQPKVVVDGNLITGRDPISSQLFGETVAKQLTQKE